MVIQLNMTSKDIAEIWEETIEVFQSFNIPIAEKNLPELVNDNNLYLLLTELNKVVGSSNVTCIEGG